MKFAPLTKRLSGDGANAWEIHMRALIAQEDGQDIVIMSVGDSDFDTPAEIVSACINALNQGDTHYVDVLGRDRLRRAVAAQHQTRTGQPTGPENVIICSGCQNALFNSAQITLSNQDEVIVLEPMYVTYEATLRAPGAALVPVQCPSNLGFRPDTDQLRNAVTDKTNAIAFANPVNPTGVALPLEDLQEIADTACAHDLWVFADEVYATMVFEDEHISIASLPGMAERTITLGSLSKSHAMTGWRVGWAIGPQPFIAEMEKLVLCSTYGLPGFLQEAASHALENEIGAVAQMRDVFRARRDIALEILSDVRGLTCKRPQAGMFLIIDIRQTGLTSGEFVTRLFEDSGVSVLDGAAFGPSTDGTVRMCFAVPEKTLRDGCGRIRAFAEKLSIAR